MIIAHGQWSLPKAAELLRATVLDHPLPAMLSPYDAYVFVRDRVEYVPDEPGRDEFQTAALTLARAKGDCEDFTILILALTRPYPAIARVYGANGIPRHVAPIVDGIPLDVAARLPIGRERPGYDSLYDVRIR